MAEQEQQPDSESPERAPQASGIEERADWMKAQSDARVAAWTAEVEKFAPVINGHLEEQGLTDPETIEQVKKVFVAKVRERKASKPNEDETSALWTAIYFSEVVPMVNEWSRKSRVRKILNSSDAEFDKYTKERDTARHQEERAKNRDSILADEKLAADQRGKIKEAYGADTWSLTDDEFKAMIARDDAVRHASKNKRERLAADTWRIREAEQRERRK